MGCPIFLFTSAVTNRVMPYGVTITTGLPVSHCLRVLTHRTGLTTQWRYDLCQTISLALPAGAYPLAAAAAVVVVVPVVAAAIAAAAEGAAAAAVAEQQDQNDDPPPVVVQAAANTVIIAHKITSDSFR